MNGQAFPLIAVILAIAAATGLLAVWLRQPLIMAFIAVGILVGPAGIGWVIANGTIELLSRLGIAILLFLVGLRLDPHLIRAAGPVALATGLGQIVFTSLVGYLLAVWLGMDVVTALYVAVALTFSSTIIIVKLLSDKRELEQLHGRIAVGFLIVQDIVAVLAMIAITTLGQTTGRHVALGIAAVLGKGLALLAAVAVLTRYALPWLLDRVARSQELLVLFGVAYAASVAAISAWLGFGTEIGAFLAGVSVAGTNYRDALGARLVSLRDFMLLFFFLNLGATLDFTGADSSVTAAVVLSAFVLIGNPLIVIVIMSAMRYPVKVGFLCGLTVAQISEFSLILAALGLNLGHIGSGAVSLITLVGLITIGGSTYLILYSHQLYHRLERWLSVFDRTGARRTDEAVTADGFDAILFGLGRFGGHVAQRLDEIGHRVLAVDYDPQRVADRHPDNITAVFGSADDIHLLETLPLSTARYVISTVPTLDTNRALLAGLRHHDYQGRIAVTALTGHDAEQLRSAGADIILEPYDFAAETTSELLDRVAGRPSE